jgi:cytochrome c oxidase subunit II
MFKNTSEMAKSVDMTFLYIVIISVIFLVGVIAVMIYFVIKYDHKRHPVGKDIEGNFWLELTWITIPTLLALSMFYVGFSNFKILRTIPPNAMQIGVRGQMWKWSFTYNNKKTSDTLYVPVNQPIKLNLSSIDVVHSFYIPAFRVKEDAVPGKQTYIAFTPDKIGNYQVECAEYCGLKHSYMWTSIKVVPEDEFNIWFNSTSTLTDTTRANNPAPDISNKTNADSTK